MEEPPVEKGRLLINLPLAIDTLYYGAIIALLSLANFAVVAFVDGDGVAHTRNCNYELVRWLGRNAGPFGMRVELTKRTDTQPPSFVSSVVVAPTRACLIPFPDEMK